MEPVDHLLVVQFPHPGREHELSTGLTWSTAADHFRRFMVYRGKALERVNGSLIEEDLCFWGEWEAGAKHLRDFSTRSPGMPHHLYRPEISTKPEGFVQNTDPLVFGSSFLYTNCKQRGQGKLKHLAAGSIILFGSRVDRRFCLDTLFVVGSSQWYSPGLSPYPETLRQNSLIKE